MPRDASPETELEVEGVPVGTWPDVEVGSYRSSASGIGRSFHNRDGNGEERLTNFPARIVASLIEDDGVETRRFLEMEALRRGKLLGFKLSTSEFHAMTWPLEQLGPDAIVFAGPAKRDRAREAIQLISGEPEERRSYAHTGWREIDGEHFYFHAGGAIGAKATLHTEMALPEALKNYAMPEPSTGEELRAAVQASLRIAQVAPLPIVAPLYALITRAIIGGADFSAWLTGQTGAGKSEIAALVQQHFGAAMNSRSLPAAWQSTANANQELAFAAKDALLVVDDFVAIGSGPDANRLHRDADHLLRGQGNRAGRQRMRADATLRPPRPPRGLVLGTGEDVPRGQSLRGRMLIVQMGANDLRWDKLTACQNDAEASLYAAATAGFIRWLATRLDDVRAQMVVRSRELRAEAAAGTDHKRTPEITAQLGAALEYFFAFACDVGAIGDDRKLWAEWWTALSRVNQEQASQQAESDPARRFVELLRSAISAGEAHVASSNGGPPNCNPKSWGWRQEGVDFRPKGLQVGWVEDDDLFLDFDAAHRVVQEHGKAAGEALLVTPAMLRKRMNDAHLLKATDGVRGTLHVRKMIDGVRRNVLHLAGTTIVDAADGQVSADWSGRAGADQSGRRSENGSDSAPVEPNWSDRSVWSGEIGRDPGRRGQP